jgi:hypothetical protein
LGNFFDNTFKVKNKLLLRKLCSVSAMDKVVGKLFCRGGAKLRGPAQTCSAFSWVKPVENMFEAVQQYQYDESDNSWGLEVIGMYCPGIFSIFLSTRKHGESSFTDAETVSTY